MHVKYAIVVVALLWGATCPPGARAQERAAAGSALWEAQCSGCHSLDENDTGPKHRGVVGRKIASVPDFDYSDAIRKLGGVWSPDRLDKWLQNPQAMAPGAYMYVSVPGADDRQNIIAYLATQTDTGK
jgi:cytochrome c